MFATPRYRSVALLLLCGPLVGCYTIPTFWDDRSPAAKRMEIQRFDPYPENNIGPPMTGVRPPGFGQQLAEPARSRWGRDFAAPVFVE